LEHDELIQSTREYRVNAELTLFRVLWVTDSEPSKQGFLLPPHLPVILLLAIVRTMTYMLAKGEPSGSVISLHESMRTIADSFVKRESSQPVKSVMIHNKIWCENTYRSLFDALRPTKAAHGLRAVGPRSHGRTSLRVVGTLQSP
jgi:hypothetical protein